MTVTAVAVVLLGMFAGGVSSGAVGFGVVLVGAPIIALGAPHLLPSVFVAPSIAANGFVALSERRHRDSPLLVRLMGWQLPGMAVGLWILSRMRDADTGGTGRGVRRPRAGPGGHVAVAPRAYAGE